MKRGEIYYIENDNAVGCEQRGIRPAVIVGNDVGNKHSPVLLVVYFTRQQKKALPTHVYVRDTVPHYVSRYLPLTKQE